MEGEYRILDFVGEERVRFSPYRYFILALVTLLAFVLAASALRGVVAGFRTSELPYIDSKIDYLRKNIGRYDTLVLGTSRIYRGLDPAAFDTKARELGCQSKTFNFGIPDLRIRELDYLIGRLRELDLSTVKRIILDPQLNPDHLPAFFDSERGAELATWGYLPMTIAHVWADPLPTSMKAERTLMLAAIFLRESTGAGHLSRLIKASAPSPAGKPEHSRTIDFGKGHGFIALDRDTQPGVPERLKRFQKPEVQQAWAKSRDAVKARPGARVPTSTLRLDLIDRFVVPMAKLGPQVQFLFVSQPILLAQSRDIAKRILERWPRSHAFVLDIDDHPDLFNAELWFDEAHFTSEGARRASAALGEKLCRGGAL